LACLATSLRRCLTALGHNRYPYRPHTTGRHVCHERRNVVACANPGFYMIQCGQLVHARTGINCTQVPSLITGKGHRDHAFIDIWATSLAAVFLTDHSCTFIIWASRSPKSAVETAMHCVRRLLARPKNMGSIQRHYLRASYRFSPFGCALS